MSDEPHTEAIVEPWENAADGEAAEGDEASASSPDSELAAAEAKRDEYLADLQRLAADFDNYRKRALRDNTHSPPAPLSGSWRNSYPYSTISSELWTRPSITRSPR